MKRIDKLITFYWISVLAFLVMSATILVMPFAVRAGEQNRAVVVTVGLIFWISLIAGYIFFIAANAVRKKIMSFLNKSYSSLNGLPGIISFFSNPYASIADTTMIISLAVFVLINFTDLNTSYLAYVFLFLLVFSTHMHCLLNGKIFKMIKVSRNIKQTRRDKKHE